MSGFLRYIAALGCMLFLASASAQLITDSQNRLQTVKSDETNHVGFKRAYVPSYVSPPISGERAPIRIMKRQKRITYFAATPRYSDPRDRQIFLAVTPRYSPDRTHAFDYQPWWVRQPEPYDLAISFYNGPYQIRGDRHAPNHNLRIFMSKIGWNNPNPPAVTEKVKEPKFDKDERAIWNN